jgi:hypothetical protein
VVGFCEHSYGPSGSIKKGKLLFDRLSDYHSKNILHHGVSKFSIAYSVVFIINFSVRGMK